MGARRAWLREQVAVTGARYERDEAGNQWFTLPGRSDGRRADRRAHGLGAERRLARRLPQRAGRRRGAAPHRRGGRAAGHGAARRLGRRGGRALRPLAVRLVGGVRLDARPGRAGEARRPRRRRAARTRCARTASSSRGRRERASQLANAKAYLELHIEQGPVLESMDLPLGVVLGTFGVERSRITWRGQAAHAGSTPMDKRRDALAGAAKLALDHPRASPPRSAAAPSAPRAASSASRASSRRSSRRRSSCSTSATSTRRSSPGCSSWRDEASERFAAEENIEVEWEQIWQIEPILFDDALIELADESIREVAGTSHRLPSGPLHDAAEVSRSGVPTVMLFVQSLRGLSHTPLEDTKPEHLELSVQALDRLASKTIERVAAASLTRPKETLAALPGRRHPCRVEEQLIYREEVVQLLLRRE